MSEDEETYHIVPTEEEVRREAVGKIVECSILKDRIAEMESDIANLRYLIQLLDETTPSKDADGRVDIRPVYKTLRARIMEIMCQQMDLEQRMDALQNDIENTEGMANVKVIVKKL
ncbi:MAG: hypothetical protein J6R75_01465 [Candidatus Methanomethylophilaceae archaeon]|jgi:hypothetical protein|nr:hypothetical protein [Candidatus Methanomethylophilaceae archaeon]